MSVTILPAIMTPHRKCVEMWMDVNRLLWADFVGSRADDELWHCLLEFNVLRGCFSFWRLTFTDAYHGGEIGIFHECCCH